jgi:hypothetical protein
MKGAGDAALAEVSLAPVAVHIVCAISRLGMPAIRQLVWLRLGHRPRDEVAKLLPVVWMELISPLPFAVSVVHDPTSRSFPVFEGVVGSEDVPELVC